MKRAGLFIWINILCVATIIGQDDLDYIFFSNADASSSITSYLDAKFITENDPVLVSMGDNAVSFLEMISASNPNIECHSVIGDKDDDKTLRKMNNGFSIKKKSICPDPLVEELDDHHVMITLNSNWFLDHQYKFNAQNQNCDIFNEIHLLEELEDILEDYDDWNKIIVTHHGIESISEIAGKGMEYKNLIPLYGQLYLAFRKNIGHKQDITSQEYKKYVSFISKIVSKFDKLCIISGHDKLNHVIHKDYVTHINVNSSDHSYNHSKNKETAHISKASNLLRLRMDEGRLNFTFHTENESVELADVFKKREKVFNEKAKNDKEEKNVSTTVKASEKYDAGRFTRSMMGNGYRDAWSTEVTAPLLDIKSYDGGLKPYAIGGGLQTMSVKFKSKNGKKYAFRVLDKQPEKSLSDIARESVYRVIVQELITTMHPYSPLVAHSLLEATDIIHIKPELFILKPHPLLEGKYDQFVGKMGTLEEKPAGKNKGGEGFYGADKVVSSYDMFISLRKSYKHKIDPLSYAKARLMDMYLGDWDRHEDNWKWAMYKEGAYKIYKPIPKDRDHVFSKWSGFIPNIADMAINNAEDFGEKFGNLRHLNFKARFLDRELAGEVSLEIWLEAVAYLQKKLSDEVIDHAVLQMPEEVYSFHGEEIKSKLKSRREDLARAIKEYYLELNKEVYIKGTNKKDLFEIERLDEGKVKVSIYTLSKKGKKGTQFFTRTMDAEVVEKIYCFGLDGDDEYVVSGEVSNSIKVRIIGGSDEDKIEDLSLVEGKSRMTQVYDSSNEDAVIESKETVIKRPSIPAQYNPYAFDYNWLIPSITLRRSSGNGFGFGGGFTNLIRGFNKPGFAKRWKFSGVYYPNLKAYRVEGGFTFRHFIGMTDLDLRSRYSSLYDKYPFYYGIGNDTKVDRERRRELNRIDYNFFDFEVGTSMTFAQKSTWKNAVVYENHNVKNRDDVIAIDPSTLGYGKSSFIGLKSTLDLDFTDNQLYPENGAQLNLSLEGRSNIDGALTSNINTRFSYFKTLNLGLKTTLIGSLHYKQANGNPAFYHLSRLGSQTQFRGYTRNRFIDKYAMLYNSEVRVLLGTIKTPLIQFVVGVFGFYDGGRVWNDSSEFYAGEWNNSYGGGFFFAPGTKEYSLSFLLAWPEDDFTYSKLQFGFDF